MKQSLRALLSGIIDYAGTFPPARLSAEETVRNYLSYRRGEYAWMLGRLVWPALKLAELPPLIAGCGVAGESPVVVAAAFSSREGVDEFINQFERFGRMLSDFHDRHHQHVVVDAVEVALPVEACARSENAVLLLVEQCVAMGAQRIETRPAMFFEIPHGDVWGRHAECVINDLGERQSVSQHEGRTLGFKLRTGGLTADAFPSINRVAWVIAKCRDRGVPWKATAGLHHPLRSVNDELGVTMQGFVNLAAAAAIDSVHHLDQPHMIAAERDEDISASIDISTPRIALYEFFPDGFAFLDDGLRHAGWKVTTQQIIAARRNLFLSFGSCSFEEPVEEMRVLRFL